MDTKTLAQHQRLIERQTVGRLVEFTGLTRQAIYQWRQRGIPRSWYASIAGLPTRKRAGAKP